MTVVTAKKNLHDEKGGRGCKYIRQDEGVVVWCNRMRKKKGTFCGSCDANRGKLCS